MQTLELTKDHARKVLSVVDAGLVHGKGEPKPGAMCVEAAVCFALGLPHSDEPPCVGGAVRSFKIALNDSPWSSNAARAKGLRRIAIAQLGSNEINQTVFVKELALAATRKIVPIALRAAASMPGNAGHKEALESHAQKCESAETLDAARYAARCAASYAARYAASAASAASYAASDAARYAASAASAASYAASDAARYAASARDEVLSLMAECGVEALQKAGSPGCKWLDLCEAKEAA